MRVKSWLKVFAMLGGMGTMTWTAFATAVAAATFSPPALASPDVAKTYVVKPGDTLNSIAAQFYGDGTKWKVIADANNIKNPRDIKAGQQLSIPKL